MTTTTAFSGNPVAGFADIAFMLSIPFLLFLIMTADVWVRKDAAWWAATGRTVAAFLGFLTASFALAAAMYFWTIPVLRFIFSHKTKILWGSVVAIILGIWSYTAYEDYKFSGPRTLNAHLCGAFHTVCIVLFITAFINFHDQGMALTAMLWAMGCAAMLATR